MTDLASNGTDEKKDLYGVDPTTMDMSIISFVEYLIKLYSGDFSKIIDYLREHGFVCSAYLKKSNTEICDKLALLSRAWTASGITSVARTAEEFNDQQLRESYLHSILIFKYQEHLRGARFWKNRWAKEMRGTYIFVNPETQKVKCMSFKLPRGSEVTTGMTRTNGINTQDIVNHRVDILDYEQQVICEKLCNNQPIKQHLTSKADGCLVAIVAFKGIALKIMAPLIDIFGSEFACSLARLSMDLTGEKRLLVLGTQGTIVTDERIIPYIITSMLTGSGIATRTELESFCGYMQAWNRYGKTIIQHILNLNFFDDLTDSQTFLFEAICKNRRGLYGDKTHNELAISYNTDRLIFLGTSLSDCLFYIPHTTYNVAFFEEPTWWNVSHADQTNQILAGLDDIIMAKLTKKDFFKKFPPSNFGFDINNDQHIQNAIIDFEGFVAMSVSTREIIDSYHIKVSESLNINPMIYSKIKTHCFYVCHKFAITNVPLLCKISETAGHIFPLSLKVTGFFESGIMQKRLISIRDKIMKILDFHNDGQIMSAMRDAYLQSIDVANAQIKAGKNVKIPKNPLNGFDKRPFSLQCKMALNFKGFDIGRILLPIYLEVFPEIDQSREDINVMVRNLTLELRIWENDYFERIQELTFTSSCIQELVLACIGTTIK